MPKAYNYVYVNAAELLLELYKFNSEAERGRFIMEVAQTIIRQQHGVNEFADKLMSEVDDFREKWRQRKDKSLNKGKEPEAPAPESEKTKEQARPKEKAEKDPFSDVQKFPFGRFKNVLLTLDQEKNLREKYGDKFEHALEILSSYKASSGKKYKNDYAAFFTWVDKRLEEEKADAEKNAPARSFNQMDKDDAAERCRESFPGIMKEFNL